MEKMEQNIIEILYMAKNYIYSLTFENIASFSSIVGLILSILLLYLVKDIKKRYIKKIRTPETIKDLELISSNISFGLKNFENNKFNIFNELGKCKSTLSNLYPKVESTIKKEIKPLINKLEIKRFILIRKFTKSLYDLNEEDIYKVYVEINLIIERLKQEEKDLRLDNV